LFVPHNEKKDAAAIWAKGKTTKKTFRVLVPIAIGIAAKNYLTFSSNSVSEITFIFYFLPLVKSWEWT
jgi:hypothetical protein